MVSPFAVAQRLLDLVTEKFETYGVSLPANQYVAPGATVAFDGEQVTVHVAGLFPGRPGAPVGVQDPAETTRFLELWTTIVRDTPTMDDAGNPPLADSLSTSAQEQMGDLERLGQALEEIRAEYLLVGYNVPFAITAVRPVGPEGGCVGTLGIIQVSLFEHDMVWG